MHDFVSTYAHRGASTEDFKATVEKHMKPSMDLGGNGRMDWFFNEWVYRKELPSYRLEYYVEPQPDGTQVLQSSLTQSGVPDSFVMRIPIYAKFKAKPVKIGDAMITGNTTGKFQVTLPEAPKDILLNVGYEVLTRNEEVKQVRPAR
jgi:aminopeptidase N